MTASLTSLPCGTSRFGKAGRTYTARPLLHHQPATASTPERVIIQYARRRLHGLLGVCRARPTSAHHGGASEALDALHFTAEKYAASLDFHQGDIQYANNLSIFHARGAFRDSA